MLTLYITRAGWNKFVFCTT